MSTSNTTISSISFKWFVYKQWILNILWCGKNYHMKSICSWKHLHQKNRCQSEKRFITYDCLTFTKRSAAFDCHLKRDIRPLLNNNFVKILFKKGLATFKRQTCQKSALIANLKNGHVIQVKNLSWRLCFCVYTL